MQSDPLAYALQNHVDSYLTDEESAIAGAAAGALTGIAVGTPIHHAGKVINKVKDVLAARQGLTPAHTNAFAKRVQAGPRFAGGLVLAALGGMLGPQIKNEMMKDNPLAQVLAKAQVDPASLTDWDQQVLQENLADVLSTQGIV